MDGIGKLPIEVQLALNTLSMFGASARVPYLELLESQLKIKILEPLKEASGLVTNLNGSLHFCHDRIQETSLNLIEEHDRRGNHLSFGKCLITTALDANDNGMLFTAVDQINLAGPSAISDYEDYFNMASYNLAAGLRAMNMAEFGSALAFFENGISFLRDGHWQDVYPFSLQIYELACKSAIAAGKIQDLNVLSEQVLKNARTFEDTLEIQLVRMKMFAYSNPAEAFKLGLSIVSKLGEKVPSPSKESLEEHIKQTQTMVKGLSEDNLLNYKIMSDSAKLIVMKFLFRLQFVSNAISPATHPLITLKMLQITITYGEPNSSN